MIEHLNCTVHIGYWLLPESPRSPCCCFADIVIALLQIEKRVLVSSCGSHGHRYCVHLPAVHSKLLLRTHSSWMTGHFEPPRRNMAQACAYHYQCPCESLMSSESRRDQPTTCTHTLINLICKQTAPVLVYLSTCHLPHCQPLDRSICCRVPSIITVLVSVAVLV